MSRKVEGWQSDIGTVWSTKAEADSEDARAKVELLITDECTTGYDRDIDLDSVWNVREALIAALQTWTVR